MSAQVSTDRQEVNIFLLIDLMLAIKIYINTGRRANSFCTPKNMLVNAGEILGKTYESGQLRQAHDDLQAKCNEILKMWAEE